MTDENIEHKSQKLQWETPLLESIGDVDDVAGQAGTTTDGVLAGDPS